MTRFIDHDAVGFEFPYRVTNHTIKALDVLAPDDTIIRSVVAQLQFK